MSNRDERFEELAQLLSLIDDGEATQADCDRLNDLLRGDPEACEFYIDFMAMSANLELEFGASKPIELEEDEKPENVLARTTQVILQRYPRVASTMWNNKGWMSAAAVAMLSASVAGWMLLGKAGNNDKPNNPAIAGIATDEGVAVLRRTLDAEFGGASKEVVVGETLEPGEIRLDHGGAIIEFYDGARVLLEGGSVLQLIAENEAFLKKGRLRAQVPPQAGKFILETRGMDLVARGAELGAVVGDGTASVHNFEGRVSIVEFDGEPRTVEPGTGFETTKEGGITPIQAEQRSFLSWVHIVESSLANASWRYRGWRAYRGELITDPRVVVYYTFEDQAPEETTLADHAANGEPHHGAIVNAGWDTGRWSGKGALKFTRGADRVRFDLDHVTSSATWLAWVRVDQLQRRVNALAEGSGSKRGTPQWHLTKDGELQLNLSRGSGEWVSYTSKPIYKRRAGGASWRQLATVYHADAGFVIHYADGEEVARIPINAKDVLPIEFKAMQIGNWTRPKDSKDRAPRNLRGAIDEFIIFDQALSVGEISDLYGVGKP